MRPRRPAAWSAGEPLMGLLLVLFGLTLLFERFAGLFGGGLAGRLVGHVNPLPCRKRTPDPPPRPRSAASRGVPSWWLIESTSVSAHGDRIESPDGTHQHGETNPIWPAGGHCRGAREWPPPHGQPALRTCPHPSVRSLPAVLPRALSCPFRIQVVGVSGLPFQVVRPRTVIGGYDTGMDLLTEAAGALEIAAEACESPEDAAHFSSLADRVRSYLATSRPSTTLGMPRIPPGSNRLTDESVVHRSGENQPSHIRVIPD
jgi:hypothetical protein